VNPIVDRQTLEAAITATLDRDDLASTVPAWIRLAEAVLNRLLDDQEMHACVTAETDKLRTALPTDWVQTDRIEVVSTSPTVPLVYCEPHALAHYRATSVPGIPAYYSYIGRNIEFNCEPEGIISVKIDYKRKLALADTPTSKNWLLTSHPDAYLYGALVHSAPYLKNDPRLQTWGSMSSSVIEQINARHERAKVSGSRLNRGNSLST
jgi:hypothetical protein